jgi:signal transduction histidine kinase/ActR/RegA family two-component response regulator/HAMP domain-containing protein
MTPRSRRSRFESLRIRLPLLLLGYLAIVGVAIFLIVSRTQERRFEAEFAARQIMRATDLQDRTERAAERNELGTAQREFGEMAQNEALTGAVFVSPDHRVILSSRREWLNRPVDLGQLGIPLAERSEIEREMARALTSRQHRAVAVSGGDRLVLIMPASLPLVPGALAVDRSALIVLSYDLSLSKAIDRFYLQRLFLLIGGALVLAVFVLGLGLHFFVTRRLEQLQGQIDHFATGAEIVAPASRLNDEIGEIGSRFQDMAHTIRREMSERAVADEKLRRANRALRAISHCNQALVHATDEPALLNEICRVIVEDGGYRLAWVAFARATGVVAAAQWGADDGYIADSVRIWDRKRTEPGALRDFLESGRTRVTRDFRTDPFVSDWKDEALKRGMRSSATFALREDDRTFGALMIYSDQAEAFDEQEMLLLTEMAEDLAYGIQALRTRTRRMLAEETMREANERYARQESALATLTRLHVTNPEQFPSVMRSITEVVANTLEVDRASVWRQPVADRLICEDLFERQHNRHSAALEITGEAVEEYARMLSVSDIVVSSEAMANPRVAEFASRYMARSGMKSFLTVPIRGQGELVATLSCSTIGEERKWSPDEQTFLVAVANLLSSLFAQVERQRLEAQLRQATKLEGIGQLAGGVAHDFNNVLTVILGKAGQIIDDARLPVDLRDSAEDIVHSAERAANLTRQLLAFSRRQAMQVRDHDLNAVIRNVARLLDRILGEDLALELALADEPTFVRADAGMLDQVVLNLAVNAGDAMRGGGRLIIRTSVVDVDARATGHAARPSGPYACLQVCDTGTGIAKEHLAHIFEPFFTTKDVGKGTGLGLATTYGIVQQHNGWIEVDSEVGRGTTFSIFLPSFTQPGERPEPIAPPAPRVAVPRAAFDRESILVVEDEEEVRSLIVDALIGFGYRVLEATSGAEAIEEWAQQGASIDLLITDMVMPGGMNGLDLASRLKADRPHLRVIYISGYLADVSRDELSRSEGANYLAKPFTLPTLARIVREALDAVPQNNP